MASATPQPSPTPQPDADTIRILVTTDNHVGYQEKDKIRGGDALSTLEEIFQIARAQRVDFILNGGDLFHENKPSRTTLYKCMDLLRKYCLGPGDVAFEVVSDPNHHFSSGHVNYEDPNFNVEIPFFMIHGNHDDPGGEGNLCAANLLEIANLINYFGRTADLEEINIKPILIRKGATKLALYGLGNIRDERLNRAFQAKKVHFEAPTDVEDWFHILILHQNRYKGNAGGVPQKGCIHEQMLPSFLDLIIWGHEHDCLVEPRESLKGEFYVTQPGSSVATSLSSGEVGLKHIGVVEVCRENFRCIPHPLWSVRPLVMDDKCLSEMGLARTNEEGIWNALTREVEELIRRGQEEHERRKAELRRSGATVEAPELPLVRLRVEHTGFDTIGGQRFGHQFVGRVANPEDVLLFFRKKAGPGAKSEKGAPDNLVIEDAGQGPQDGAKIQDIVYRYLEGGSNLHILPEPDLNIAVQQFVHSAEPCAIEKFVKGIVDSTNRSVLQEGSAAAEDGIRTEIQGRTDSIRKQRLNSANAGASLSDGDHMDMPPPAAADPAPITMGEGVRPSGFDEPPKVKMAPQTDFGFASAFATPAEVQPTPAGRRGARGGRGAGRGRGRGGGGANNQPWPAVKRPAKDDDDDDEVEILQVPRPAAGRGAQSIKTPRVSASGTAPTPGLFFQAPGESMASRFPGPDTAAPPAATQFGATPAPTPFLRKRGLAAGDSPPDIAATDIGVTPTAASQPSVKRQWVFKKTMKQGE